MHTEDEDFDPEEQEKDDPLSGLKEDDEEDDEEDEEDNTDDGMNSESGEGASMVEDNEEKEDPKTNEMPRRSKEADSADAISQSALFSASHLVDMPVLKRVKVEPNTTALIDSDHAYQSSLETTRQHKSNQVELCSSAENVKTERGLFMGDVKKQTKINSFFVVK